VFEYACPGTPQRSAVEAAPSPEIVMVRRGAYIREDAAGEAFLDSSVIGFFEAGRPYTIRHLAARPDTTTVLAIKDIALLREALGVSYDDTVAFGRSVVRAPPVALLLHRQLNAAVRSGDRSLCEEIAVELILFAASLSLDIVIAGDGVAAEQKARALAIADLISQRFRTPLTLQSIADNTGLSVFQVARAFREHFGASVRQHILTLRLDAALEALLDTNASVTAIAHDVGFASHSHLTALTTRVLGLPPTALRRDPAAAREQLKRRSVKP
jgi:AraC family transcriptional regulator